MIGIVGQGYVGKAIKGIFDDFYIQRKDNSTEILTYDKKLHSKSNVSSLKELVRKSEFIFVCVPTPSNDDNSCHTEIVEDVVSQINSFSIFFKKSCIVIIKSTVPPGTTKMLDEKNKNIDLIFNPEFLREASFMEDFKNQNRIILGGKKSAVNSVEKIYNQIFKNIKIIKTESSTAEMVKYLINTFLATKVSFANEMKLLCDKANINYEEVIKHSLHDDRLGNSHWSVPGPDGKIGFGGSCFPKDLKALIFYSKNMGIDLDLLNAAWNANLKFRPEKDWEQLKGRSVVNKNNKG